MLILIIAIVVAVFAIQAWNRHGSGKKIAPAQIFKLHMCLGVLVLAFFFIHGLPKLLSGWAPLPNLVTGCLLALTILATVILGAVTKNSRGAKRKALARCHGIGAATALVLLVVHVGLAIL